MCVLQAVKGRDCPWRLSCSARGCWPSPLAGRCTPASTPSTSLWLQVRALLDTKPQLLHLTVQHPCPLNDFLVVWGKKIPYYLFIFAFLQVSSCTPSAARNGGMEIEILFFFGGRSCSVWIWKCSSQGLHHHCEFQGDPQ